MKKLLSLCMLFVAMLFAASTGLRGSTPDLKQNLKIEKSVKVDITNVSIAGIDVQASVTLITPLELKVPSKAEDNIKTAAEQFVTTESNNLNILNSRKARDGLSFS